MAPGDIMKQIGGYLSQVRAFVFSAVVCALIGVGAGVAVAYTAKPSFSAQATVLCLAATEGTPEQVGSGHEYVLSQVRTWAGLIGSPAILSGVVSLLGLDETPDQLAWRFSGTVPSDTTLVVVSAKAGDAQMAIDFSAAAASALVDWISRYPFVQAKVLVEPTMPLTPTNLHPMRDMAVGTILGAFCGVAQAVLRNAWRRRSREVDPGQLRPTDA